MGFELWPSPAIPCDSSARQRQSAGRSVWSPSRWGDVARWCNRTAPLCSHTPWWSQSYLCSQTLRGEQQYTNTLFIWQAYLGLQRVGQGMMEMSLSREQTATGQDTSEWFKIMRSRASFPARRTMTSLVLLRDTPLQLKGTVLLFFENPTSFIIFHEPLPWNGSL